MSLQNLEGVAPSEAPTNDRWIGDRFYCLYMPIIHNTQNSGALDLVTRLQDWHLDSIVRICVETEENNLEFLHACVDSIAADPEPYLEVVVGGSSTIVLHYRGDEIMQQLSGLSRQICKKLL